MKLRFMFLVLAFAFCVKVEAQEPRAIPGQYIVELKESSARPVILLQRKDTNRETKESSNQAARTQVLTKLRQVRTNLKIDEKAVIADYADVMAGFVVRLTPQEKAILEKNPDIAGVYPDYVVSLGPIKAESNAADIKIASQYVTCAVTKAGGPVNGANKATWIWILDTGIDLDHPDLNVQTSSTYAKSFISGQSVDDGHGHGTHVAGIAAAKSNNFGVVGVSAGARVVPVKVLSNTGSGSWSSLISGLNHVAKYDIPNDVVNMSLGGYGYSNCENSNPILRNAIRNLGLAGTHVVMAAGNDSGNANINRPGCINGTRVYTVGALTCNYSCASYSNWGSSVDWAAVGTGVYSTYKNKGYATLSGTSMASPVVAGIIHARGGAPLSAGNVNCSGGVYKIAKR